MDIVVLCHLYYQNLWEEIRDYLLKVTLYNIYFNLVDNNEFIVSQIKESFPTAKIFISPNQGKDCGGNLRLINEWIKDGSNGDLIFQCHTKSNTPERRKELFTPLLNQDRVFNSFKNEKVGMVGSGKWLFCEKANGSTLEHKNLCDRFGFDKERWMTYIAGTIFIVRAKIYKEFFSKINILEFANVLEYGDVQEPSYTHGWERFFATIVEEQGYEIFPL